MVAKVTHRCCVYRGCFLGHRSELPLLSLWVRDSETLKQFYTFSKTETVGTVHRAPTPLQSSCTPYSQGSSSAKGSLEMGSGFVQGRFEAWHPHARITPVVHAEGQQLFPVCRSACIPQAGLHIHSKLHEGLRRQGLTEKESTSEQYGQALECYLSSWDLEAATFHPGHHFFYFVFALFSRQGLTLCK